MASRDVLDKCSGTGSCPLGSKSGNVEGAFTAGHSMDIGHGIGWAGDRDTNAGNKRRASGGSRANSAGPVRKPSTLAELSNVDGRNSKKDGQRYGGNPTRSGANKGPSGIRSKKGKLK